MSLHYQVLWWGGGGGVVVVGSPPGSLHITPNQTEVLGVSHAGVRIFLGAQSFGYISAAVACGDNCRKRARNHCFCTIETENP